MVVPLFTKVTPPRSVGELPARFAVPPLLITTEPGPTKTGTLAVASVSMDSVVPDPTVTVALSVRLEMAAVASLVTFSEPFQLMVKCGVTLCVLEK